MVYIESPLLFTLLYMVHLQTTKTKVLVYILAVVFLIAVIVLLILLVRNSATQNATSTTGDEDMEVSSSSTSSVDITYAPDSYVVVGTETTDPNIAPEGYSIVTGTLRRFTSPELGFTFTTFSEDEAGDILAGRTDGSSKVWVYYDSYEMEDGQSVEIFSMNEGETALEAVARLFLTGVDTSICRPTSEEIIAGGLSTYSITFDYPADAEPGYMPAECPQAYSQTNGVRFFATTEGLPNKLLFFDIGQYVILGDANYNSWFNTVHGV